MVQLDFILLLSKISGSVRSCLLRTDFWLGSPLVATIVLQRRYPDSNFFAHSCHNAAQPDGDDVASGPTGHWKADDCMAAPPLHTGRNSSEEDREVVVVMVVAKMVVVLVVVVVVVVVVKAGFAIAVVTEVVAAAAAALDALFGNASLGEFHSLFLAVSRRGTMATFKWNTFGINVKGG